MATQTKNRYVEDWKKKKITVEVFCQVFLILFFPVFLNSAFAASPTVGTVTPSSGTGQVGASQAFTAAYSDPDGWQDLATVNFLVNTQASGANCLSAVYNQNTNLLYIRNDAGTAWLGGYAPGSANTIQNSYASLDCSQTSVSGNGNTLTVNWKVTFKSPFTGAKNTYLLATDDGSSSTGVIQKGVWIINAPPTLGTITPSSGTGQVNTPQTFTATYSDPDGWQNLNYANLLINTQVSGANCLSARYDQNTNLLYMRDDSGAVWLGGYAPGSANTIQNSYATLDCSQTSVSGNGTTLTVNWKVTLKGPFTGTKNTYLLAIDDTDYNTGAIQKGAWTIPNNSPSLGTIVPSSGSGQIDAYQTFTATYSDPDGWQNLSTVNFLVNTQASGANCLSAVYDQNENLLYIRNDAGTTWLGGYAPGSANTIQNSYATLDCSQTSVSGNGNTLTINWKASFKSTFIGAKNTYLLATDDAGVGTGVVQKGAWTINRVPTLGTIAPSSGTFYVNTPATFTGTYSDPDGWQNLATVNLCINAQPVGSNGFSAYYDQNSNLLYMRDDSGTVWEGGYAPGSANTIQNSYASLDCSQTSVSGADTTLTVNWKVTFKSPFTGAKNTYLLATDDAGAGTGVVQKGTATIPNNSPSLGTIAPSSGTGQTDAPMIFTAAYSDPDGWQNLSTVNLLVNTQASGANCLSAYYDQNANLLYMRDDSGTAWEGGYAPGSANSIQNSYASLDCSQTSVSGNGTTLTVNWKVAFKSLFTGAKNTYLLATDDAAAATGVIQKGTWTISTSTFQISNNTINPYSSQTTQISYALAANATISIRIYDSGDNLVRNLITNQARSAGNNAETWDGKDNSNNIVPDDYYYFIVEDSTSGSPVVIFDPRGTGGADITLTSGVSLSVTNFDTLKNQPCTLTYNANGHVAALDIRTRLTVLSGPAIRFIKYLVPFGSGTHQILWDGRDEDGRIVGSGTYLLALWAYALEDNAIVVTGGTPSLSQASVSPVKFNPVANPYDPASQDETTFSFDLSSDAYLTVDVYDSSNALIRRLLNSAQRSAGQQNIAWDGKNTDGKIAAKGHYRFEAQAQNNGNYSDVLTAHTEVVY